MFQKLIIILLVCSALIVAADAEKITISVGTNTTTWTITRESESIKFDYSQYVQGNISPVEYRGRSLEPYHSSYEDVKLNDIRLHDRTSALKGSYATERQMVLRADTTEATQLNLTHEGGIYSLQYTEEWPAIIRSSKSIRYSGQGINSREYAGNNLDYAGSNLLYNKELSKDSDIDMLITRLNATVQATDYSILFADFKPKKETYYDINAYTTGIADLKYGFASPEAEMKWITYPLASEGEERYYGVYNISRSLHMRSDFPEYAEEEEWLPCCSMDIYETGLRARCDLGDMKYFNELCCL